MKNWLSKFKKMFEQGDDSHTSPPPGDTGAATSIGYTGEEDAEQQACSAPDQEEEARTNSRIEQPKEEAQRLTPMLLVIDPGHGGHDSGAVGPGGTRESNIALDIGKRLRELAEKQGIAVHMTRDDDTFITLGNRVKFANDLGADIFLSIHCNANQNRNIHGMEVYHHGKSKTGPRLAKHISGKLAEKMHWRKNRGVKSDFLIYPGRGFYVLRNTAMTAVMVETDYISNPYVERQLNNEGIRALFAESIIDGIQQYWKALNNTA